MLQVPNPQTAKILELADFFETLDPAKYTQTKFFYGEARCICGWANYRDGVIESDHSHARDLLGLDDEKANRLFHANAGQHSKDGWFGAYMEAPSPKDAAKCLRHLAVTGELPAEW